MQIDQVKKFILENYLKDNLTLTVNCSLGNYDDVFDDGVARGYSEALLEIGEMLGMELPMPEDEDDEDLYEVID